ncbi:unnamed protein product [Nippostrongylus brasiliensis]|uniref:Uncharacterized protein n=1 Tax=Nippostrongylus brasiliensis TaxID=27835 RepID=A0A0N4Y882_NIPBR|nr:unnamed protein product [Nippostrongylus brasiliensis]
MLPCFHLILVLILLRTDLCHSQSDQLPFYNHPQSEVPLLNRIQVADYQGASPGTQDGIDAGRIIGPLMTPFMEMFEVMQQKVKARAYMDKINREREESPLSSSRSVFEMIERLQRPTTSTTPQPPLLERLLRPYIEPWQQQIDDFSKGMAGMTTAPSTTEPPKTTSISPPQNIIEKSLRMFFPSLKEENFKTTTTPAPKFFDASMIEKLFFSRSKRQALPPLVNPDLLNPFKTIEKPILELANPFTPNPLMALFTTKQPIPELPKPVVPKFLNEPIPTPLLPEPQFKLQDPFYNPLFPNRKSKLFDILAGGEAARFLG